MEDLIAYRLTLTWDVLKRLSLEKPSNKIGINFNMGCIETDNTHNG